jgi:PAS domain S-box-containing protein
MKYEIKNDFLNSILDSFDYPFLVIDPSNYTVSLANSAARSNLLSKESTCHALTHKRDTPCNSVEHPCPIDIIKKTKQPVTLEHIHYDKDGNPRHVEVHAHPVLDSDGNVSQVVEYSIDITERKRKEEMLRESEERYRILFEESTLGIPITDIETGLLVDANSSFCRMFGYPKEELLQLGIEDLHPKDSMDHLMTAIKSLEQGEQPISHTIPCLRKDGTVFYADITGSISKVHGRKCSVGFFMDITERKLAEEQLHEKEETLKVITESTNDAIIIMNNRGIITFWNTAASNMLGYSKEETVGKNLHELIAPERFLNAHLSAFPQFIKTGKGNAVGTTLELYAISKDHIEIPVELSLSSIMIEREWFAVGIMRDNTARKHAEKQRDRLILDLQKALSEVKTLRGFLPICSHCKKIRDDKGYWNQIESYIHKHTDTEFSHGICPECAEKYFPEMDLYGDDESGG